MVVAGVIKVLLRLPLTVSHGQAPPGALLGSPSQVGELEGWVCKFHPPEEGSTLPSVVSAWQV